MDDLWEEGDGMRKWCISVVQEYAPSEEQFWRHSMRVAVPLHVIVSHTVELTYLIPRLWSYVTINRLPPDNDTTTHLI